MSHAFICDTGCYIVCPEMYFCTNRWSIKAHRKTFFLFFRQHTVTPLWLVISYSHVAEFVPFSTQFPVCHCIKNKIIFKIHCCQFIKDFRSCRCNIKMNLHREWNLPLQRSKVTLKMSVIATVHALTAVYRVVTLGGLQMAQMLYRADSFTTFIAPGDYKTDFNNIVPLVDWLNQTQLSDHICSLNTQWNFMPCLKK